MNTTWAPGAWLAKGVQLAVKANPLELDEELLLDELELEEELLLDELELDELELEVLELGLLDLLLPQPVRLRVAIAQATRARRWGAKIMVRFPLTRGVVWSTASGGIMPEAGQKLYSAGSQGSCKMDHKHWGQSRTRALKRTLV